MCTTNQPTSNAFEKNPQASATLDNPSVKQAVPWAGRGPWENYGFPGPKCLMPQALHEFCAQAFAQALEDKLEAKA